MRRRVGGRVRSGLITAALGGGLALGMAVGLAAGLAAGLAGCGIGAPAASAPTPSPEPQASLSGAIELTRGVVEAALRPADLGLIRAREPFRPAESTALIDAPRGAFQVVLADDPEGGYLVIYELPDPAAAYAAGLAQAAWLASGPGAVQAPSDTQYVLRQVGNTLVSFGWSPANSPDPRTAEIATALETVGRGIPTTR